MKKQQIIVVGGGVVLLCLIYFLAEQFLPKRPDLLPPISNRTLPRSSIKAILSASRQKLSVSQQEYITRLEASVVRGDVKEQQIQVFKQMAGFWRDSAQLLLPYAYYTAEAAKLENSQKNLTFAAQFFLDGVRRQAGPLIEKLDGLTG